MRSSWISIFSGLWINIRPLHQQVSGRRTHLSEKLAAELWDNRLGENGEHTPLGAARKTGEPTLPRSARQATETWP
jgi:hypothetical protein